MTARLYVGTYAKYNSGSIAGAWVDLEQFADSEEFHKHCAELHKDESDPEFMFQDFEGFPKRYYSESGSICIDELFEFLKLTDCERLLLEAYIDATGNTEADLSDAEDAYSGNFSSDLDFAYEYIDSTGMLANVPESIQRYFDYESFARDLMFDYVESDGFYFSNY